MSPGAQTNEAAKKIALSIANSPLVKTAIAGGDANWGRVVMAVGKAGEAAERDKLKIMFGAYVVADKGERAPTYNEGARHQRRSPGRRWRFPSMSASARAKRGSGPAI